MSDGPETTPAEAVEALIAEGDADAAIIEILGQEYGGPDGARWAVVSRIWDALRRCGALKEGDDGRPHE